MRTRVRVLLVLAVLGVGAALFARRAGDGFRRTTPTARPIRALPPDSAIRGAVIAEHRVGEYVLRILEDSATRDRMADITRAGRRVFAVRSADVRLDPIGVDVTGDGVPDVVVHEFSGGMHCCSRATVLGLGDRLQDYGTVDGAHGEVELTDADGDGVPELKVGDWRFAYWREYPFAETPAPEVLYRFRNAGYEPACDLMRRPAPDAPTLARRGRALTAGWTLGDPPTDLWGFAVDLIYQGHADLAFSWLETTWPRSVPGRSEFLANLRARLAGSPCWSPAPSEPPAT